MGANGTGKTTLLKLATGLLVPNSGTIERPTEIVYCPQRTDNVPCKLSEFIKSTTKLACVIKGQLDIGKNWFERWETLSHGERKRAQIAVALWQAPTLLAVDEPTNHLDSQAREFVANALRGFNGIGLLVSHDRELHDLICRQSLFIEPPTVISRSGSLAQAMKTLESEDKYLQRQNAASKHAFNMLKREFIRRREQARKAKKRRSKRGLKIKDHDARDKKDRARISGKDAVSGKLQRQMQGRMQRAEKELANMRVKKEYELGIWLPRGYSKRNTLLKLEPGTLPLGKQRKLCYPELIIHPRDRIAVTGPNGSGKSTIIEYILGSLNITQDHIVYIPQEINLSDSQNILAKAQAISSEKLGYLMNIVSRLGSRPERLLNSNAPTPGETRKLLLAIGITRLPHIIIMDEPTNHMDLPSIECLENALSDCPCSLVLVSHDKYFLGKLAKKYWNIIQEPNSPKKCILQIKEFYNVK